MKTAPFPPRTQYRNRIKDAELCEILYSIELEVEILALDLRMMTLKTNQLFVTSLPTRNS
ncbi:MAG: hypothetical protein ACREA9_02560 [Pyrinomonadaceae bacterium]